MNIKIIAVGRIKENYTLKAIEEYKKRLQAYCSINIIEIPPAKILEESDEAYEIYKRNEAEKILSFIKPNAYVFTLEIEGKQLSSIEFAQKIANLTNEGYSEIIFIIGGANGLHYSISQKANFKISFSKMTFTHQMIREVLVEQVYRSFKIIKNEPYHR